jgi:poly(3-hydroxyalkanoate) synthetase
MNRRGPRPLLLHLIFAMLKSTASVSVSPHWNSVWQNWSADNGKLAEGLAESLARGGVHPEGFPAAVLAETLRQDGAMIAGIAAYRRHPFRRDLPDPPVIWREGGSRILDFSANQPGRRTVLFVPSLVNRAYVLDLAPGRSMMRHLADGGLRPLLLDWGWPGEVERSFSLTDYVAGRLERALTAVGPVILAGFCMGGLLAVAAAQRRPDLVRALILLATPWDFASEDGEQAAGLAGIAPLLEPAMAFSATLSVDLVQTLFALLDPYAIAEKYRAFGRLRQDSERARLFVALEDWLNDGVPLAAPVARECLAGWYGRNTPQTGQWRIAGLAVDPSGLDLPAFAAIPRRDRIVPPESARPLAAAIAGCQVLEPLAGHIGMVAGASARAALWAPLLSWIDTATPALF